MPGSVILASGSAVRRRLLERAGVPIQIDVSDVDEAVIKAACRSDRMSAADTAHRLAVAKAEAVSPRHPEALVLAADQLLVCGEDWYDKPVDLDGVRNHLQALQGRTHHLVNATVIVQDGRLIWGHDDAVRMDMRPLTNTFVETYINAVGEQACQSVGAYQLEGLGAQLFERADGDFFSILGLPLLPVLAVLREQGIILS